MATGRAVYAPPVLLAGLVILLVWLPVPLGSNRPWAWSLMHAASLSLLGLWCAGWVSRPDSLPDVLRQHRSVFLLLACWIAYVLLQAIPLPAAVVEQLSPTAFAHHEQMRMTGMEPVHFLSMDPGSTLQEAQKLSAYAALFLLTLALVTTRRRLRIVMVGIVVIGTLEAFYGLLVYLSPRQAMLWYPGFNKDAVSGTYVNRNHFAGLMEMSIAAALGLIISETPRNYRPNWRDQLRRASDALLGQGGWLSFCLTLMIVALLLSTSRGGIAALILGIGFMCGLSAFGKRSDAAGMRVFPRIFVLAFVGIAWLGAGGLLQKIESVGISSNRAELREVTLRMAADFSFTGSGAGTFPWVFPAYKDERLSGGHYTHAHNDFLQLLAEQGVVGFALAAAVIASVAWRILAAYVRRRDPLMRGALFASGAGSVALLAHGAVDFNFHIPANAAMFFVLLGLGGVAAQVAHEAAKANERIDYY